MNDYTKILLEESELPTRWYNVIPDLPEPPPPPLHPGTREPATAEDFAALFPQALIEQEMSAERYIDIPAEVLDVYRLWRPSPLFRARRLEKLLSDSTADSVKGLVRETVESVEQFAREAEQADDITMIAVQYNG